jgi:hypothetical protein
MIAAARGLKSLSGQDTPDTGLPPQWLNRILEAIFGFERHLIGRIPLPLGVSLFAIARAK